MEPTVLHGIEPVRGERYEVVLNGPHGPVTLHDALLGQIPPTGTPVTSGPAGITRPFDPDDPVTVELWLRGDTALAYTTGPSLIPDEPGDIVGPIPTGPDTPHG